MDKRTDKCMRHKMVRKFKKWQCQDINIGEKATNEKKMLMTDREILKN